MNVSQKSIEIFPRDAHSGARFFLERVDASCVFVKQFAAVDDQTIRTLEKQKALRPSRFGGKKFLVRAARIFEYDEAKTRKTRRVKFIFENALSGSDLLKVGSPEAITILGSFVADTLKFATSTHSTVLNNDIVMSKILSILGNTMDSDLEALCEKVCGTLIEILSREQVLVGNAPSIHGDLTLSNIMVDVKRGEIILFDFLAGYHELISIDIAKLLQEFRYGWSSRFLQNHDRTRSQIIYKKTWPSNIWNASPKWFIFSVELELAVTLLRIAPYVRTDDKITKLWLMNALIRQHQKLLQASV